MVREEILNILRKDACLPESPTWHKDVLDKRRKILESGNAKLISISELKNSDV